MRFAGWPRRFKRSSDVRWSPCGYMTSNPAGGIDLPPEGIKEQKKLPTGDHIIIQLINALEEPISTLVYLVSVTSVRPEELAFKWLDMVAETRNLGGACHQQRQAPHTEVP